MTDTETTETTNVIRFRADDSILKPLAARSGDNGSSLHLTARRDLERLYALLDKERRTIAGLFTVPELSLILDSSNGTLWEAHTMNMLWVNVEDSIKLDRLDAKWKIDGESLVERLRSLSPGAIVALVDAVERFWNTDPDARSLDAEGLMSVGLVPAEGRE